MDQCLCRTFIVKSHSTLIGYPVGEVFNVELQILKARGVEYCNIHTEVNKRVFSFI